VVGLPMSGALYGALEGVDVLSKLGYFFVERGTG